MQTIIYYANDEKLAKQGHTDFDGYRKSVKKLITEKYPDANVTVSTEDNYHVVRGFDTDENPNGDAEVVHWIVSLMGK